MAATPKKTIKKDSEKKPALAARLTTPEKSVVGGKPKSAEKYFQGIGRRKRAIAGAKIYVSPNSSVVKKELEILINKKSYENYFPLSELREIVMAPLKAVLSPGISRITVAVRGGGIRGQAEATRLGIARALVLINPESKKTLRDLGFLTRDARVVERKKPGLKKARRAPQFSKR